MLYWEYTYQWFYWTPSASWLEKCKNQSFWGFAQKQKSSEFEGGESWLDELD